VPHVQELDEAEGLDGEWPEILRETIEDLAEEMMAQHAEEAEEHG
jgi:hypothetical protein